MKKIKNKINDKAGNRAIKTISISAKCSDLFYMTALDSKGEALYEYDGYVPGFFPDMHYGDYIRLNIDIKTGKIINWNVVTSKQVENTCRSQNNRLIRKAG